MVGRNGGLRSEEIGDCTARSGDMVALVADYVEEFIRRAVFLSTQISDDHEFRFRKLRSSLFRIRCSSGNYNFLLFFLLPD